MADPYADIAAALSNRRQRFYQEQPALQAALSMQPIYTRRDQNQTKGAIAGGLQGLAKALMGAYGIKNAQANQAAYDRDFTRLMQTEDPINSMAADPRFAEVGSLLANQQYQQTRDLSNKVMEKQVLGKMDFDNNFMLKMIESDPKTRNMFRNALQAKAQQSGILPAGPAEQAGAAIDPAGAPQTGTVDPNRVAYFESLGLDTKDAVAAHQKEISEQVGVQQRQNEPDMAATKAQLESIPTELQKANALDQIADTVLATYDQAGYTGPMNNIRSAGMNIAAMVGVPDQQKKLEAQTRLDSVLPEVIKQARTVGGGAVSDYESKLFVASGPGSTQPPEVNRFFGQLYKERARLAREQVAFKQAYYQKNKTLTGAEQMWQQLTGGTPLVEQGPDGQPKINQLQIPWQQALQGGQMPQQQSQAIAAQPAAQPQANMPQANPQAVQTLIQQAPPQPGESFEQYRARIAGGR